MNRSAPPLIESEEKEEGFPTHRLDKTHQSLSVGVRQVQKIVKPAKVEQVRAIDTRLADGEAVGLTIGSLVDSERFDFDKDEKEKQREVNRQFYFIIISSLCSVALPDSFQRLSSFYLPKPFKHLSSVYSPLHLAKA